MHVFLLVWGNISRKSSFQKYIQNAYTYLIHSEIFGYPQCKQMLVSIYQATNQDRWCKQLIGISKFSTMSAQTISALKRQVCLKNLILLNTKRYADLKAAHCIQDPQNFTHFLDTITMKIAAKVNWISLPRANIRKHVCQTFTAKRM